MSSINPKLRKPDDIKVGDGKPPFEIDLSEARDKYLAELEARRKRKPDWKTEE